MYILILATLLLVLYWISEYYRHLRNVRAIPIRIHVNGTRGKSSVTRLIAAGLRAGGKRTIAKITGTLPRVVLPDGQEGAIIRLQSANIIEQKYIFRYATELKPEAIVIECMAVNPVFQWITERKFVRSTVSVITNCRPDHQDLMGNTVQSITMSLSNTIPPGGICYTAEYEHFPILKQVAAKRHCRIVQVRPSDVTDHEMKAFHYIEHPENVQLALAVCAELGISREVALAGMQESRPDPGALRKYRMKEAGKWINFYNVFAANDPQSTERIMHMLTDRYKQAEVIIILNSRADRFFRSQQLVEAVKNLRFNYLMLTGEICEKVESYALHHGLEKDKVVRLGDPLPEVVYSRVLELTIEESHVIGIGNIAGEVKYGAQIVAHFRHRMQALKKKQVDTRS